MPDRVYVEVVDLEGITHHIGPFKARSNARDWIAQHSCSSDRRRGRPRTTNEPRICAVENFPSGE